MPKKTKKVEYTGLVSSRRQMIAGVQFNAGDPLPYGLIGSAKIKQLRDWNRLLDAGHERMDRMRKDGWIRD